MQVHLQAYCLWFASLSSLHAWCADCGLTYCLSCNTGVNVVNGGRINIASCSVGGAQFCTDVALEYVQSRHQFGKPIGTFQNTEFKLADMATAVHASRVMVR